MDLNKDFEEFFELLNKNDLALGYYTSALVLLAEQQRHVYMLIPASRR